VAGGVLFVAEYAVESNRVQTFTIAVDAVTRALTLTHRSFIGGFASPRALFSAPDDAARACVFVSDCNQISCIDVASGAVRSSIGISSVEAMTFADGLLYALHGGGLSIVHADSGAIQQSAVRTLHGHSWEGACDIVVLPDFVCVSDGDSYCVHVIPRSR
jgi:hypothetical protein